MSLLRGQAGEAYACQFLIEQGLTLLEKNFYAAGGEIDLIMQDKQCIVFVEVKLRSSQRYGTALEMITETKIQKLISTAMHFLQQRRWFNQRESRFDVIAIQQKSGVYEVEWVKNAFMV